MMAMAGFNSIFNSTITNHGLNYYIWAAPNMGFAASVAGRKNNRQFYKAKLQFGQDKQL